MEYKQEYPVNQLMHNRPCARVIQWAFEFYEEFPGISIKLQNDARMADDEKPLELDGIMELLLASGKYFKKGTNIDIIVKGDYPLETLKDCSDTIGYVFSNLTD